SAWKDLTNEEIAADIIAFVRRYALGDPLIPQAQRIQNAMLKVKNYRTWNKIQLRWLERFEKQLLKEAVLEKDDFDKPPFRKDGGFQQLNKIFNQELEDLMPLINEHLYA